MIRAGLLIASILMTTPALAQDVAPYDPQILNICMNQDKGLACAGILAERCMAEEGYDSTVGMGACLRAEVDHWDEMLNDAYLALGDQVGSDDSELNAMGSAADRQEPALVEMQRKWIAFRDATCAYERTRWQGGTGSGPGVAQCVLDLTARQTMWLRGYVRPTQ